MTDISFDKDQWNFRLEEQRELCKKLKVHFVPLKPFEMVGLAFPTSGNPFNALRYPPDNYSGWFLWVGEYSVDIDFFKPVHAFHLLEYRPDLIKYLALPAGYRIQIDDKGYEDIWYDASLESPII